MKALLKQGHGLGMDGVSLVDIPKPVPKDNEVLIKVMACGICGTDLHIIAEEYAHTSPVVLGHEFTGTIEACGSAVTGFTAGEQVFVNNINGCGHCHYCKEGSYQMCAEKASIGINLNGGMAEYVVAPADHVFHVPASMQGNVSVALSEPLCCCVRAVFEHTDIKPGDVVLVTGPGAIGQICAQLAKIRGAYVIVSGTKVDLPRLELAKKLGADAVASSNEELLAIVNERTVAGVDILLECSGAAPALSNALDLVRKQGQYTQVGVYGKPITVDMDKLWKKEIVHRSSFATTAPTWEKLEKLYAMNLLKLDDLVSACIPLANYKEAF
ncbi:MAG: alcohol dehydrogenase catalytic domain-containing protein, partial [Lachnospiraceae bacterium]|nr:alcohol dehydrogenase catalytic domain-containing protein [Lachnospiraceae bacterium]